MKRRKQHVKTLALAQVDELQQDDRDDQEQQQQEADDPPSDIRGVLS